MPFRELPRTAAWSHRDARTGFEVVVVTVAGAGFRLEGHTAATEAGEAWTVHYVITIDDRWCTRSAHVEGWSRTGRRVVSIEADGAGSWSVDGRSVPELDGCFDVDLAASACTNTMPVHRLDLGVGDAADAPAVYVRAPDLGVERLEQRYARVDDCGAGAQYDYAAPAFGFEARLVFDERGLVLDYPGIARRAL